MTLVTMPQLGESVAEGTIGRWLKQPGQRVERDEPLVEVQTDKVNAELPCPVAGILQEILQPEGATVPVLTGIAVVDDGQPSGEDPRGSPRSAAIPDGAGGGRTTGESRRSQGGGSVGGSAAASHAFAYLELPDGGGPTSSARLDTPHAAVDGVAQQRARRFYTPVVLRMAQEHRLDLERIEGSGANGRVTRRDVERVLSEGRQGADHEAESARSGGETREAPREPLRHNAMVPSEPPGGKTVAGGVLAPGARDEHVPLTPMRRAIARHMAQSRAEIPDVWSMVEIDMTRLVRLREAHQAEWQAREGFELTFLPYFLEAVISGLRAVPAMNATWKSDADGFVLHRDIHLGIAVAVEDGLVVPVLRDADQYSVAGLARAARALAQKARSGKLTVEDLQGATFVVNNPGALGSVMSQPIIPVGVAGIVTMEAIVKRPVVVEGDAIAVRSMMHCCLSFDHRLLDGAQALRFLQALKGKLEAAARGVSPLRSLAD